MALVLSRVLQFVGFQLPKEVGPVFGPKIRRDGDIAL
jgi:hypothetical protein